MRFDAPIFAWGADFYGAETGELLNLVVTGFSGGIVATVPVTVDTGFFGFVISPSQQVGAISFQSRLRNPDATVGQGFGLENVVGAYTEAQVPEPNSLVLLITGTALMGSQIYRRRRGRRHSGFHEGFPGVTVRRSLNSPC